MTTEVRTPSDDEFAAVCAVDGRAFGFGYTDEEIERIRPWHDMGRWRIAVDGGRIVATAGTRRRCGATRRPVLCYQCRSALSDDVLTASPRA